MQHARTIVKAIRDGEVEALRKRLRLRGDEVQKGHDPRFHDIPGLHFLSCCILEQTEKRRGWFLVVELSFDGDVRRFLESLVEYKRDVLDELLSSCVGYPDTTAGSSQILSYLLDRTSEQAVYLGAPGRSRQQIDEETGLRRRVAALLDQTAPFSMSRAERWQHVVDGIYTGSPGLRGVPARPLRVRLNVADPVVRARFAAGCRLAVFAAAWITGVVASFFLARTPWLRALVLAPPLLGVWAAWVFIRLSPRGLATHMRRGVWGQGIREGVRTAMYAAPVGGLALAAGALDVARAGSVALVIAGALLAGVTIVLVAALVFSIFGSVATAAAAIAAAALLWLFPWAIVPAFAGTIATIVALLVVFALRIRDREARSDVQDEEDNLDHLRVVTRREYQQFHSHLASEAEIAAGAFRMRTLRSVLRWVNTLAFFWFNLGHLDKITSIHVARFIVLPGRRTLLFLSNYDGRFEDYLGAFSTVTGVTAVWGNTAGFSRPFLLLFDGARAENLFKRYARASQVESLVWFSAYPNQSVAEIDRATFLRESLARPVDHHDTGVLAALRRVVHPTLDEQTLVYLMDGR